ncbi:fatty acyl-CoA reductase wat isoform X2 [Drosophila kikkawai]|uniref:Fatty acyl-CoA reductase n=1 Tax=Drosophila kikkawai TaxID=30033 RepID=A0ABM4GJY6_DROKI
MLLARLASSPASAVLIEKLLRTTKVKRIYVLLRTKNGQDVQDRFATWETDPVFLLLLQSDPDVLKRVAPLAGDCQAPDLGLSPSDRQLLLDEVQVVFHGAATVRFMEPLHIALAINTRAALLMMELAKEMQHLVAFVHVSTAFSNCVEKHIEERYYPENLNRPVRKVLQLYETLDDELVDNMTPVLLGKFPNTYTYTKALAEQLLQNEAGDLPFCIFRPGAIIATYKEPMSGWIDNLYGPIAVLYGAARGFIRITLLNVHAQAGIVPVDYCVNTMIVLAWDTARNALKAHHPDPPIYNFTPSERRPITWGGFRDKAGKLKNTFPLNRMLWKPFLHCTRSMWLFKFLVYFYHLLPGYAIDMVLRLRGRKPRLIKLYDKIHKNIEVLSPFVDTSWKFDTNNTQHLWKQLSPDDQLLYEFDMSRLDWDDYFKRALAGLRIYLGKEDPGEDSLKRGRVLLRRFTILHSILQFVLFSGAFALLWSILKPLFSL